MKLNPEPLSGLVGYAFIVTKRHLGMLVLTIWGPRHNKKRQIALSLPLMIMKLTRLVIKIMISFKLGKMTYSHTKS